MHCEDCEVCECNVEHAREGCHINTIKWLMSEHKEKKFVVDWTKVPVDTKILVKSFGKEEHKRYFSHYDKETGRVFIFDNGNTSWSNNRVVCTFQYEKDCSLAEPNPEYMKEDVTEILNKAGKFYGDVCRELEKKNQKLEEEF